MVKVLIGASLELAVSKLQQTDLSLNSNLRQPTAWYAALEASQKICNP